MQKLLIAVLTYLFLSTGFATPIQIVAAENFYGALAQEIGGSQVAVYSILQNPEQDPHLFTTAPATSKALAKAQIIIYNGADYDPWIKQLLVNLEHSPVLIINVANLMHIQSGANPHLWYQPQTFPSLARVLADKFSQLQPEHKAMFEANLKHFKQDNARLMSLIVKTKAQYANTQVIATEPVYGYMADALGLKMEGLDFQWKVMNGSEPTPKMMAKFQQALISHQVKLLIYNQQVTTSLTQNLQDLARSQHIPVQGVGETMPANLKVNQWLLQEVQHTAAALAHAQ